ncbi:hypothetical protein [Lactiplantibacillus plantarum]|uniref:hypothetical protein n=1 Tax=Lactiplantibacillus plantarum TaxID=1590 RepID=UPI0021A44A89|nr:hypothetical protein [Lactiplantibacillus plantarum]MCT3232997.1 hypothetical protein [Lactiplantibacillus plantarum]MCT3551222.1 hypothetical protein [Lactiplantibacillus plantarum]
MNIDFQLYVPIISKVAVALILLIFVWQCGLRPSFRFLSKWTPDKLHTQKWFWKQALMYDDNTKVKKVTLERSETRYINFIKSNLYQGKHITADRNKLIIVASNTVTPSIKSKIKKMIWTAENWDRVTYSIHYKYDI